MDRRRPVGMRVAAAVAAFALAVALPVLIVLSVVVDERWRPLVGMLTLAAVLVPLAAWFVRQAKQRQAAEDSGDGAP